MDTTDSVPLDTLAAQARLQVKVQRTLLRHKLIMVGNSLLVAYLFAVLLQAIWWVAMSFGGRELLSLWATPLMGLTIDRVMWLSMIMIGAFKIGALLLLLLPGLGLRICGSVMEA